MKPHRTSVFLGLLQEQREALERVDAIREAMVVCLGAMAPSVPLPSSVGPTIEVLDTLAGADPTFEDDDGVVIEDDDGNPVRIGGSQPHVAPPVVVLAADTPLLLTRSQMGSLSKQFFVGLGVFYGIEDKIQATLGNRPKPGSADACTTLLEDAGLVFDDDVASIPQLSLFDMGKDPAVQVGQFFDLKPEALFVPRPHGSRPPPSDYIRAWKKIIAVQQERG